MFDDFVRLPLTIFITRSTNKVWKYKKEYKTIDLYTFHPKKDALPILQECPFCSNYVLAAQQTQQLTKKKNTEKKEEDDKSEGTKHLTKKDESGGALGPAIIETMYAAGGVLGPLLGVLF